jgi:serine/threonine-protein kinase
MDIVFLKRYQAVRLLGEGRTGRAYLAQQIDLARPVFVKVIGETLAAAPDFRERFARDTAPMARFQHPFAVAFYHASVDESLGPCLVMEYVRGLPLDQLVKANKGRLGVGRVYRLRGTLCDVLQAAHAEAIVHGNLKPPNVIVVEPDSPYEKIKVTEFGMARFIKASDELKVMSDESSVTRDQDQERELNSPLITPYLSPEQVQGEAPSPAGDMFSLGVILFELLTGWLPARSSECGDLAPGSGILRGSPTALPRSLEAVLFGCLEREPKQRIHSPRELAELFGAALARNQRKPTRRSQPAPVPEGRE